MDVFSVVLGLTLIAVTTVDVVWTTVAASSGAGPISTRVTTALWRAALVWHRRRGAHRFLVTAGVMVVMSTLAVWVVLLLAGWALVFGVGEGAVRVAETGAPADLVDRFYFTGFTVFTLGVGDMVPGQGWWQLATVAATGTGLALVTTSITFLVPVVSAAAQRRHLASTIAGLGGSSHDIVRYGWNGRDFSGLLDHLTSLPPPIQMSRQQHLAYPVLHYLHSVDQGHAAPVALANLSGALHLLRHGVAPEHRPDDAALRPLERAIDGFLDTVRRGVIDPRPAVPVPQLAPLTDAGIPTVDPVEYESWEAGTRVRREGLAGLLAEDGWIFDSSADT